jgi:hypothetical protein
MVGMLVGCWVAAVLALVGYTVWNWRQARRRDRAVREREKLARLIEDAGDEGRGGE